MNRIYRILCNVVPRPRDDWIRAHQAELEHIPGRWARWRWTMGLVPLAVTALVTQLRHDARTFVGGVLVKSPVAALTAINFAAGVGLAVLYLVEPNSPLIVLALSGALLIQSGFTLALMLGTFGSHRSVATRLQRTGSMFAVVVGAVGFVAGILGNISPTNGDPEYGPLTMAFLIAAHGIASLLAFTSGRSARAPSSQL